MSLITVSHRKASTSPRPAHVSCSQAVSCRDRNVGYVALDEAYCGACEKDEPEGDGGAYCGRASRGGLDIVCDADAGWRTAGTCATTCRSARSNAPPPPGHSRDSVALWQVSWFDRRKWCAQYHDDFEHVSAHCDCGNNPVNTSVHVHILIRLRAELHAATAKATEV